MGGYTQPQILDMILKNIGVKLLCVARATILGHPTTSESFYVELQRSGSDELENLT